MLSFSLFARRAACVAVVIGFGWTAAEAFLSSRAQAQDLHIIRVGTGSTAGTYFPIGGLIANAISNPPGSRPCDRGGSCGVPGLIAVAQSTGGSVQNLRAVAKGDMEMGLSQADVTYWAHFATGPFQGQDPMSELRALAMLFPENIHLIARQDSGIESIYDLKGKRISLGGSGSGSLLDGRLILSAFGLKFGDMTLETMDLGPSADALVAGEIDALFFVSGAPALAIQDVAAALPVTVVPIAGPIAVKLTKIFPFFVQGVIPAGTYGNEADIETLNVGAELVVRADMDEDLAYGITRALWHPNNAALFANGHPRAKDMKLANAVTGNGIKFHPGAARYYIERGLLPSPVEAGASDGASEEAPS